jgi:uncharacterized membrane protein
MTMAPGLRKAVLTTHVASSVGWLGAVLAYIALDVTAVISDDRQLVRAAYAAMEVTATYAIVPLAVASVVIGTLNALGTSWGLLQHYWVLMKLLLTLVASVVLLVESRTISTLADAAATGADPRSLPGTLPHSIGGLVTLVLVTILSVYKPRGMTPYGWRKQQERRREQDSQAAALSA